MSVKMGTSFSTFSFNRPGVGKNSEDAGAPRILSDDEVLAKQKALSLLKANAGKRKSSDMDEFFLKYTEHRNARVNQSIPKMAKVMSDSKDKHIITTNGDAATDEMKRIAEKFGLSPDDLNTLNIESKGDTPLSDAEIDALKEKYDIEDISLEETFQLLAELTQLDALSCQTLAQASLFPNDEQTTNLLAACESQAKLLSNFANALESGDAVLTTGEKRTPDAIRSIAEACQKLAGILSALQRE